MTWKELFTTYWSQVTLLLLAIGYFIKRTFDDRSKKIEINHSLYQQNRMAAVNDFFRNYAKVELMWRQLQIWNIVQNKLTVTDLDKYIWPSLNALKASTIELKIYFSGSDHKQFEQIFNNALSINQKLGTLYFSTDNSQTLTQKVNSFHLFSEDAFKKNNEILDSITDNIRSLFSN